MASRSIDLISKKTNCTCSTLFVFFCRCFAQLQRCFVGLKRQTSQLHIIFMEELSYVLTQYFVSCVHVRFYFSLPLIFTLLAASISHCLTAVLNYHVFLSTKFVSFVFNHSLLLFLSNNVDVVVFFFLKVLAAMRFFPNKTLSCIWVSIPVDRIILHWYA